MRLSWSAYKSQNLSSLFTPTPAFTTQFIDELRCSIYGQKEIKFLSFYCGKKLGGKELGVQRRLCNQKASITPITSVVTPNHPRKTASTDIWAC
jgi:hypothetical protein